MKSARLFIAYAKAGFSLLAVYRLDFWVGRIRHLIVFFAMAWLWLAVYTGRSAGGYDTAGIFTYVLVSTLLYGVLAASRAEDDVAEDIAHGTLSANLTQPVWYLWKRFSLFWPSRLLVLLSIPGQLFVIWLVFRDLPVRLPADATAWMLFGTSAFLSCILFFLMTMLAGYTAFWLHRAYGARWMIHIIMVFGAGCYLPTTLLAAPIAHALFLTPLPYLVYIPTAFLAAPQAVTPAALVVQLFWIAVMLALNAAVWRIGIKRYEAVGI